MNLAPQSEIANPTIAVADLDKVYKCIPSERIAPYENYCDGDRSKTLSLYAWNTSASGAIYEVLGHFEVTLRNAIDNALTGRHVYKKRSSDWLDNKHGELTDRAVETISEARNKVIAGGNPVTRGALIAELGFGFWLRLLDKRYESIWGSAVMRQFPKLKRPNNNDMHNLRALVEPIYKLRNRVAHHEPIWYIHLANREDDMITLIAAISEDMAIWVQSTSRLEALLNAHPVPSGP